MSKAAAKILVFGDVCGHVDQLVKLAGFIHKKSGPFDAVFCVGQFFGEDVGELDPYLNGSKQFPLPTYFIAGKESSSESIKALLKPEGGALCENLTYLGKLGVKSVCGLSVAYLSGFSGSVSCVTYATADVDALIAQSSKAYPSGVDILLTAEWGRGFHRQLTAADPLPVDIPDATGVGSPAIGKLATNLAPRYHFAGQMQCYFVLPPFHHDGNTTGVKHVTRFYGIGPVVTTTTAKYKNVYACNVTPLAGLSAADLSVRPSNTTRNPYTTLAKSEGSLLEAPASQPLKKHKTTATPEEMMRFTGAFVGEHAAPTNFRFNAKPPDNYVCKICNQPGHFIRDCPQKDAGGQGGQAGQNRGEYVCRICNTPGHKIRDCPQAGANNQGLPADYVCKICNKPGHNIRDCPEGGLPADYVCKICNKSGHNIRDCPEGGANKPSADYVCKICNIPGHMIRDCPQASFSSASAVAGAADGGYRNTTPPEGYLCKVCSVPGHWIQQCPSKPPPGAARPPRGPQGSSDCWFCLATPNVATHLILSIGEANYLTLAKGVLTPYHTLLLPIEHVSCTADLSVACRKEMELYKQALRRFLANLSPPQALLCFDRSIPSKFATHMHIQCVAVPVSSVEKAENVFREKGMSLGVEFEEVQAGVNIEAELGKNPYLLVELPVSETHFKGLKGPGDDAAEDTPPVKRLLHRIADGSKPPKGLLELGRDCCADLLGVPERSNWKACVETVDAENKMVGAFKSEFAVYDVAPPDSDSD